MPWRQVDAMKERFQFVRDARGRLMTFTDLCALYGVSRTVGYKRLQRAEHSGHPGRRFTPMTAPNVI
jgi:hypothetical protein